MKAFAARAGRAASSHRYFKYASRAMPNASTATGIQKWMSVTIAAKTFGLPPELEPLWLDKR
jgi:hypothetical protein